jgi:hypothetical protein
MSQRPEFILSLAAKDGSVFIVDELRKVYAQLKDFHNPQLAMLEFTMVLPRERAQELLQLLSEPAGNDASSATLTS